MKKYRVYTIVTRHNIENVSKMWEGEATNKREARKLAQAVMHETYPGCHVSIHSTEIVK